MTPQGQRGGWRGPLTEPPTSTAGVALLQSQVNDLQRELDVTQAENFSAQKYVRRLRDRNVSLYRSGEQAIVLVDQLMRALSRSKSHEYDLAEYRKQREALAALFMVEL